MTTARVETSVTVKNSPVHGYVHQDNHIPPTWHESCVQSINLGGLIVFWNKITQTFWCKSLVPCSFGPLKRYNHRNILFESLQSNKRQNESDFKSLLHAPYSRIRKIENTLRVLAFDKYRRHHWKKLPLEELITVRCPSMWLNLPEI